MKSKTSSKERSIVARPGGGEGGKGEAGRKERGGGGRGVRCFARSEFNHD